MSNSGAASTPPPLVRIGDIVFVDGVLDPSGHNPEHRRVVILTPNDAMAAGFPIIAAPITSQVPPVLTQDHVLLPFRNPPGTRPPATGLTRRAAIVATWLVVVDRHDITVKPAMSHVRRSAGLMRWTGSQEDADFVALSPELDPQVDT